MNRRSVIGMALAWIAGLFVRPARAGVKKGDAWITWPKGNGPQQTPVLIVRAKECGKADGEGALMWTVYPLAVWGEKVATDLAAHRVEWLNANGWDVQTMYGIEKLEDGSPSFRIRNADGTNPCQLFSGKQ